MILSVLMFNYRAYSQDGFSLHGGLVFPTSDYGNDDIEDEDSGLQGTGGVVGIKYVMPLNDQGLGLFLSGNGCLTGFKKDAKDDLEDGFKEIAENVDVTFPKTIVVPISAGLSYKYVPNSNVTLFGMGGVSCSFARPTKYIIELSDGTEKVTLTTDYEMANSIGFTIGCGIISNDKVTFSLNYFSLGEHKLKGEMETEYSDGTPKEKEDIDPQKINITFVTLTIGIKL